ncbi:MAG: hypothetical protein RL754_258 [Bacteroidota bacterium]
MKSRFNTFDWWIGLLVGLGAPFFALAIALEAYPVLQEVGDITNPAWRLISMRAISFGVIVNAILFFTAINFGRDRVAKGILLSCIPSIVAVIYFQFIL